VHVIFGGHVISKRIWPPCPFHRPLQKYLWRNDCEDFPRIEGSSAYHYQLTCSWNPQIRPILIVIVFFDMESN